MNKNLDVTLKLSKTLFMDRILETQHNNFFTLELPNSYEL
ncbi:hypothetical protein LEP1GSC097_0107 [Leptospira interrogans serovar Grippotyphosa str. UI 08368]|nr:hypothetical protein LEP1GSC097_0107 [Leptospira interrogans serovar Grippotyphosa str. UI 08368]